MTQDDIRQVLVAAVAAAASTYPTSLAVEYDNRNTIDKNSVDLYVEVVVDFRDGYQADMSNNPRHRLLGFLSVAVYTKAGLGTRLPIEVLYHLYSQVQKASTGSVRIHMAKPVKPKTAAGWWGTAAILPFEADLLY